jgi:hypothetical protein
MSPTGLLEYFGTVLLQKQKNYQNYQKLKYAVRKKIYLCAVRNALNIYSLGLRLGIKPHHPAAVYYNSKSKSTKLITKRATNNFLRRSACIAFDL